ncbi:hypothetical protein D9619_011017 [Psilocybe cf. subviscida]|uniref:Nephrocystin 3-like N-terminal domain-containing protein n=1 Tax=Psilocybe cf. subviscida TaxID=2480587 RepID=A0A8H5B8B2_9AGAR|nr:hypothetical protein D9619_011017 [Psilocybe cf. subviscida]
MSNHMFTGASIGTIAGGTFITNNSDNSVLEKLSAATAHNALLDAPVRTDEFRCHRRTRESVLNNLERWARGIWNEDEDKDSDEDEDTDEDQDSDEDMNTNEAVDLYDDMETDDDMDTDENMVTDEGLDWDNHKDSSIFWLNGGAGAGKTTVMQTLALHCVAEELALGCFFFSRSDPTRNTAEVLIPTLAYQLAQVYPPARQVLEPILNRDPLIFKKSLQAQLFSLLVQPLQHLVRLGNISDTPRSRRVFLIDGLDECDNPVQQQAIIHAVAAVCYEHHIPVKFLIASRPELAISTSFRCYEERNCLLGTIALSEDPDAKNDLRRFIEGEFNNIRTFHPFKRTIPEEWPCLSDINTLVQKSSSHFIYASTAMNGYLPYHNTA